MYIAHMHGHPSSFILDEAMTVATEPFQRKVFTGLSSAQSTK